MTYLRWAWKVKHFWHGLPPKGVWCHRKEFGYAPWNSERRVGHDCPLFTTDINFLSMWNLINFQFSWDRILPYIWRPIHKYLIQPQIPRGLKPFILDDLSDSQLVRYNGESKLKYKIGDMKNASQLNPLFFLVLSPGMSNVPSYRVQLLITRNNETSLNFLSWDIKRNPLTPGIKIWWMWWSSHLVTLKTTWQN